VRLHQLSESKNFPTYHATRSAHDILASDEFKLTAMVVQSEYRFWKKGDPAYFLSLSRSPYADYAKSTMGDGSSILKINTQRLTFRYKTIPVDYWGRGMRVNEMEERVFSRKPIIPNASKYIEEIHTKVPSISAIQSAPIRNDDYFIMQLKNIAKQYVLAKRRNIPIYLYERASDVIRTTKQTSNEYIMEHIKLALKKVGSASTKNVDHGDDVNFMNRMKYQHKARRAWQPEERGYKYLSFPLEVLAKLAMYPHVPEDNNERTSLAYDLQQSLQNYRPQDVVGPILRGYTGGIESSLVTDLSMYRGDQKLMKLYFTLLRKTKTTNYSELIDYVVDKWKVD